MKPLTHEWIDKAEADFTTAGRELRARKSPNYDAVCFHAQQCAEKYLKGFLQESSAAFPKTHDLNDLLQLILPLDSSWAILQPECRGLTDFAVLYRYPGYAATQTEAKEAFRTCAKLSEHMLVRYLAFPDSVSS